MVFQQATSAIGVTLYDLVKERWAGVHLRQSVQLKARAWACYQALMPWLDDSMEASLKASPFLDHVELHNFVSTQARKARTYVKVGPAIRSSYPIAQMEQLCRKTYKDRTLLILPEQKGQEDGLEYFRDRRTSIGLALEIPIASHRDLWVRAAAKRCPIQPGELVNIKDRLKREAMLAIITATLNEHPHEDIKRAIEDLGSGLFITWLTPQKRVVVKEPVYKRTWVGKGEMVLSNKNLYCLVELNDDRATMIKTNSISQLRRMQQEVIAALKEQGIKPYDKVLKTRCLVYLTAKKLDIAGPGTPVMEMRDNPNFQPPDNLNMTFSVRINHGCLSLMQSGANIPGTIFEYKTLPIEFEPCLDGRMFKDVWKAWFYQSQLDAEVAEGFLVQIAKRSMHDHDLPGHNRDKRESYDLINFARETLLARLRHLGHAGVAYKPQYKDTTTVSEIEDPEIAAAMQQALSDCMYDIIHTDDLLPDYGDLVDPDGDLTNLATHLNWAEEAEGGMMFSEIAEFFADHGISGAPVEFVTSRLSTRYGVMQFWDGLINAINALNSSAWSDLVNGRNVAGVVNSQAIVWLLTSTPGMPARTFGKSVESSVSEEAMVAIYAGSQKSAKSRRSMTSTIQDKYVGKFMGITEELLAESDKFKGKEDLIKDIMAVLSAAKEKTDEVLVDQSSSDASSDLSFASGRTLSPITKVERWVLPQSELGPGEDYIEPPPDSMLESDELNWLFEMIKDRLQASQSMPESAVTLCYYMNGELEIPEYRTFSSEDKMVYFCHTGSKDSGHWVALITGVRADGVVECYDSLMSSAAREEAEFQLQRLFPQDNIRVETVNVLKQGVNSCGHHAVYLACHRLFNWQLPYTYSDRAIRRWVLSCIRNRRVEAPAMMYEM